MTASPGRQRVLIVDDDPSVLEVLRVYLTDAGYAVDSSATGAAGVDRVASGPPDLVLLDLKLPDMSGLDACREIRSKAKVPIIMLTSLGDTMDRIIGLEIGADDYIAKPFVPREVVARVNAVLRRAASTASSPADAGGAAADSKPLRIGGLVVDAVAHEVHVDGESIAVTPTEFRILQVLASSPGRAFSRAQLLELVEPGDAVAFDRTLDKHVTNLRRKIEADSASPRYILTVYGVGYKMAKEP